MAAHPGIFVLAGTNGAGKSSVGGAVFKRHRATYFNPDEVTQLILQTNPELSQAEANALAWGRGFQLLKDSIEQGFAYAFETTLGGHSITQTLLLAASRGINISMWYCALATPELHIARVAERVRHGGHDIPEQKIRERYDDSRRNLITLLPHLYVLRVYDNSEEAKHSERPSPSLVLEMRERRIVHVDLSRTPQWAKPIVAAAHMIDPGSAPPSRPKMRRVR